PFLPPARALAPRDEERYEANEHPERTHLRRTPLGEEPSDGTVPRLGFGEVLSAGTRELAVAPPRPPFLARRVVFLPVRRDKLEPFQPAERRIDRAAGQSGDL